MPRMFTVRAMVLTLVVLLAFVLVYPTLTTYLQHRAELQALRSEHAAAVETNEDLRAELQRWDDPAYVTAQARERLSFVMPGETAFLVVDPDAVVEEEPVAEGAVTPEAGGSTSPWYATVWESVEMAGEMEVGQEDADPAGAPAGSTTGDDPSTTAPASGG
ncbi:hypothetical protein Col01nite_25090 [Cellulomonas oligotrophica]|uniref:Septum formation initiator n=2 Tax=Cellulomonas oligotrophica TaxID=931536 RepID=A0ABQ4DC94_9CELL|nr:hypothetical protein Col01nite_25090 [Cellulomonas oligotrophica]